MISISKRIPAVAVVLIGALAFFFLHSELGVLEIDCSDHGTHEYCEIIKNSVAHQKQMRDEFVKVILASQFCPFPSLDPNGRKHGSVMTDYPVDGTLGDIYLLNRTILI
jgi:hypothetical protein